MDVPELGGAGVARSMAERAVEGGTRGVMRSMIDEAGVEGGRAAGVAAGARRRPGLLQPRTLSSESSSGTAGSPVP